MSAADIRDGLFDRFYEIASKDKRVILLSSDMDAFSLRRFKQDFPDRYINVGVAEQNMINMAAGLAMAGKKVFCYGIAAFATSRCYEQIKINMCSNNLDITLIGAGAGFSFEYDGPTHHGLQDLAIMRIIPELTIYNLSSVDTAADAVDAAYRNAGPSYIRLDKGVFPDYSQPSMGFDQGYRVLKSLEKNNLVATGYMVQVALEVANNLGKDLPLGVVDLFRIKPVSKQFFKEVVQGSSRLLSIEENLLSGGLGTILAEMIVDGQCQTMLHRLAVPDRQYSRYGSRDWFHKTLQLDAESLAERISEAIT